MDTGNWLISLLVFLGAAVLAVPLARALGLGSIIGYLVAGIAIGPWVLGLVREPAQILGFAEFGVVLMLFLVGLGLEPRRLWALRGPIFGWGSAQLVGSTLAIMALGMALGLPWTWSLVAGFGLSMSSTAIALGVLQERHLLTTPAGQSVLSVSLFQDIASIPFLALVPLLGVAQAQASGGTQQALLAVAAIAGIVLGGRLLLRPALRWIARSGSREIFTAAALLLVVAIAALMQALDLSMALGAFLAGVLLAESEYRRELETDIEPFKGLLMGLFFIAVGMSLNLGVVWSQPATLAGLVLGFLVVKAVIMVVIAWAMPIPRPQRAIFVLLLAQGGEFGFVVFQAATQAQALPPDLSALLMATVALSMLLTPVLLVPVDRWITPVLSRGPTVAHAELSEPQDAPVIVAGFGRYGQVVARLLHANGVRATVLDHDPEQIDVVRRYGWAVHYGDATRLDLLRTAGAAQARVLVVAIDDVEQSLALVDVAQAHFPQLHLVVRARNVSHWYALRDRGVTDIERETLDAALMSGRSTLTALGWHPYRARELAQRFRRHTIEQLERQHPHHRDETRLVAMTRQGRAQLDELFAQEREVLRQAGAAQDWASLPVAPEPARTPVGQVDASPTVSPLGTDTASKTP